MHRRLAGVLLGLVAITASCESTTPSTAPPTRTQPVSPSESAATLDSNLAADQVLRIATNLEPPTLDPTIADDATSVIVLRALHRGLVSLDHHGQVVPELAESWDISADGKEITFHLRDAKYSNGDPIVAGDLVYSWKRLADPRTAAPYSYVMAEVEGAGDLLAMAGADPAPSDATIQAALDKLGVSAPDDKTFVVKLATPATYFVTALTLWVFVPMEQTWIESQNATEAGNYVSSGPFVLGRWDHDSEIVLKPNPNWYGDTKPTLTGIEMTIIHEPAAQQAAYEAGELDMVQTPESDVQRVRADPVLAADYREEAVQLSINYYTFNTFEDPSLASFAHPGPTANKDFRIALTQAIDKQALVDVAYGGLGTVANSVVMPGIAGYQPDLDPYPYDIASAKAHMDTALRALHRNSVTDLRRLTLGYPSEHGHEPRVAFLAEAWRTTFGLETEQIGTDYSFFVTQRHLGEYDVSFDGWGADYPHANNQLSGLFTCHGGNNDSQYCNPGFDALIAKAATEQDATAQVSIYNEAQTILMNDAPILPLRFPVSPYEVRPYVSGLTISPMDAELLGDAHFETIRILRH